MSENSRVLLLALAIASLAPGCAAELLPGQGDGGFQNAEPPDPAPTASADGGLGSPAPALDGGPGSPAPAPDGGCAVDCAAQYEGSFCRTAVCNVFTGQCEEVPDKEGERCDDGDLCSLDERCIEGFCLGAARPCDDENPCTDDSCDPVVGCTFTVPEDERACDDGDPCTGPDQCNGGFCGAGPDICECEADADCPQPEDLCAGTFACVDSDEGGRRCELEVDSVVTCEQPDDPCLRAACQPDMGECVAEALLAEPCDDGDACTLEDSCAEDGACVGRPLSCDDGNVCTTGACDPDALPEDYDPSDPASACRFEPAGGPCDDDNPCTELGVCDAGECITQPVACEALDECHIPGECDPLTGECSNPVGPDGLRCDDGDPCTSLSSCGWGECLAVLDVECPPPGQCGVVAVCDSDVGACVDIPKPDGTPCEDEDACSQASVCEAGDCVGVDLVVCEPAGACREAGVCDPATGLCSDPPSPDGLACDDGEACTEGDTCVGGACVGDALADQGEGGAGNATAETAVRVSNTQACQDPETHRRSALLGAGGDVDWYRFEARGGGLFCDTEPTVTLRSEGPGPYELCVYHRCNTGRVPDVGCISGSPAPSPPDRTNGCCGTLAGGGEVRVGLDPDCRPRFWENNAGNVFVELRSPEALACYPYELIWGDN